MRIEEKITYPVLILSFLMVMGMQYILWTAEGFNHLEDWRKFTVSGLYGLAQGIILSVGIFIRWTFTRY